MGQLWKHFNKISDHHFKVTQALISVAAALLFGIMLYLTADVIGRYLFNNPLPASFSIGKTVLVLVAFLSFGYVQATGGNIELEFLTKRFGQFWQAILAIVSPFIGLVLFSLIFWGSLGWSIETWVAGEVMEDSYAFPYWPSRFAVVVGAFVLNIVYVIDIIKRCRHLLTMGKAEGE